MGFHVQTHYISQQPAFCDVATCHIHFSLKQHQEKKSETDVYRHICFDGNCFLMQILHKSRSFCSRSLHSSTISYSKKQHNISDTGTVPILGWKGGEVYVFGSDRRTELSQSLNQYLTAASVRPSSADASSTCHLMMTTDPVFITCSFLFQYTVQCTSQETKHSIWRLHSISVRTIWQVTQPLRSIKYNNKNCKTIIIQILWETLHEVTVFTLSTCLMMQHTHLHAWTLSSL